MNIDEHPAIPGQMGIQSIPAVIAFVNGQPADGFMGALPEGQVTAFLERLTKDRIGGEAKDLLKAADAALAAGKRLCGPFAWRDRPDFTCFQNGSEGSAIEHGVTDELGPLKNTQIKPEVGPWSVPRQ